MVNKLNLFLKSGKEMLMSVDSPIYNATVEERNTFLFDHTTEQNDVFTSAIKELREMEKAPPKRKHVEEINTPTKKPKTMASEDPFDVSASPANGSAFPSEAMPKRDHRQPFMSLLASISPPPVYPGSAPSTLRTRSRRSAVAF